MHARKARIPQSPRTDGKGAAETGNAPKKDLPNVALSSIQFFAAEVVELVDTLS